MSSILLINNVSVLIVLSLHSIAYRSGVTVGTVSLQGDALSSGSIISGLSTTFRTGPAHGMERGAIVQNVAALHVTLARPRAVSRHNRKTTASVSEEIAMLRRLLWGFEPKETQTGYWFSQAMEGRECICQMVLVKLQSLTNIAEIPLVIEVHNADIMSSLLKLKVETEERWGTTIRMAFSGATEAHLLAREIGKHQNVYLLSIVDNGAALLGQANVGVILSPLRPNPITWDQRRM